jgi:hypothetical protein
VIFDVSHVMRIIYALPFVADVDMDVYEVDMHAEVGLEVDVVVDKDDKDVDMHVVRIFQWFTKTQSYLFTTLFNLLF